MTDRSKKVSVSTVVGTLVPSFDDEVGTRVAEIAESVGGNSALARMCGKSEGVIRKWRRRESEPSLSEAREIARAGDVTIEWLATGAEPKRRSGFAKISAARDATVLFVQRRSTVPQERIPTLIQEAAEYQLDVEALEERHGSEYPAAALVGDFVMVPRYDVAASAGGGALVSSEQLVDHLAFKAEWVRNALGVSSKHLALISVTGDSMEPTLSSGDMVLLDTSRGGVEDSGIYALQMAGVLQVKRIQRHLDGALTVMSDNPKYGSEKVPPSGGVQLVVVGRVLWVGRRL